MPDGQFYGAIIWYHLMAPFYSMCVPGIKLDVISHDALDAVVQRFISAWHTETHSSSRCRLLAMKQNLNYNVYWF